MQKILKHDVRNIIRKDLLYSFAVMLGWSVFCIALYIQTHNNTVVPQEADWTLKFILFSHFGLVFLIALHIFRSVNTYVSWYENILHNIPCSLFVQNLEQNIVFANRHAREHIAKQTFMELPNHFVPVERGILFGGVRYDGYYEYDGLHYVRSDHAFADNRGKKQGTVVVFVEITSLAYSLNVKSELVHKVAGLRESLLDVSNGFSQSMQALSKSTLLQADAIDRLLEYMTLLASGLSQDERPESAAPFKETASSLAMDLKKCTIHTSEQLGKLAASYHTIEKVKEEIYAAGSIVDRF